MTSRYMSARIKSIAQAHMATKPYPALTAAINNTHAIDPRLSKKIFLRRRERCSLR